MSFHALELSFKQRMDSEWTDTTVPIHVANAVYQETDEYVELFVLNTGPDSMGFAGNHYVHDRHRGILQFNIYTRAGRGPGKQNSIADTIIPIFEYTVFDGITCQGANKRDLGFVENKAVSVVEIPFFWDKNVNYTVV